MELQVVTKTETTTLPLFSNVDRCSVFFYKPYFSS